MSLSSSHPEAPVRHRNMSSHESTSLLRDRFIEILDRNECIARMESAQRADRFAVVRQRKTAEDAAVLSSLAYMATDD